MKTVVVRRAVHLGFCFGVRDAIEAAVGAASRGGVTLLGELVHNPEVLRQLEARGVKMASPERLDGVGVAEQVMITAHGVSDRVRERWLAGGRSVVDGTCPLVHRAHEALKGLVRRGYHPVVVGMRDHVEVRGLTGDLEEFDVVLSVEEVDRVRERARFGVVAQTTQPVERALALVERLRCRWPGSEVCWVDTVCQPTKLRQAAAEELAREVEVVVVVGGRTSNNTRELAVRCRAAGARVYQVEQAEEVRPEWFEGVERIGLTAGTSTPDRQIDAVELEIRRWVEAVGEEKVRAGAGLV